MSRSGFVVLALTVLTSPVFAQKDPEPKDGKTTIVMSITPAATPRPLAEYYLLPEYRDQQPGDKLSGFLKCFMEQNIFFNKENSEKRFNLLDVPLAELPTSVREDNGIHAGIAYNPKYATMMVFMDQAARYNRIEWNEYFNLRHDGIYMLLPEIQKLRELANVLRLRMRGEVKNGEFYRVAVTAKTMFGLAKMLEQHPTLIGGLVGIAIASMAVHGLEEAIQQPGCPNLYWSFTDLPTPFFDLRYGLGGERTFLEKGQFEHLKKPTRALTTAEVNEHLKTMTEMFAMAHEGPGAFRENPRVRYALIAADEAKMEAARKRLSESGVAAEVVKAMPPLQLAMVEDFYQYTLIRDEIFKWINLPHPAALKGLTESDDALKKSKTEWYLGPMLLPAVLKVKGAQTRIEQRLAYLRIIEAIRLYAHEHGGQLPATLDDIKLPLPNDPFTGKPFEYSVKDGAATLHGEPPYKNAPPQNRYYEIRVRK
jgi:hypothetical protein